VKITTDTGYRKNHNTPNRQLRLVVQSMTVEAAGTAAVAFISCRLDYCNSLLYGLPDTLLHKLQSVQNATARLITGT